MWWITVSCWCHKESIWISCALPDARRLPAGLLIKLNDPQSAAEWCAQHTSLIFHGALLSLCVSRSANSASLIIGSSVRPALWFQLTSKSLTPPAAINFVPPAPLASLFIIYHQTAAALVWEPEWRIMLSLAPLCALAAKFLAPTAAPYGFSLFILTLVRAGKKCSAAAAWEGVYVCVCVKKLESVCVMLKQWF